MSVAIRELGLTNADVLHELSLRFGGDHAPDELAPGERPTGAVAFMADRASFAFAALVDDEAVGWLWGTTITRPTGQKMAYVHEIDVDVDHRRRGLASLMLEAAISRARQGGCHRLWLITRDANVASNALYESLGGESGDEDFTRWFWNLN